MNWEEIKGKLLLYYLSWRGRKSRIEGFLKKKKIDIEKKTHIEENEGVVKVATMQLKARLYRDPLDFAEKMNQLAGKAAREGAKLLVLPELNLLQLVGIIPVLPDNPGAGDKGVAEDISIIDLFNYIGPLIDRISKTIFALLARNYGLYIMTGSGLFPDGDKGIFNIAYLFGPDGKLLGQHQKNHLLPFEGAEGIQTSDKLEVVDTELGKLAFPICMDATYFETFRIAENKGADIVMIPIADDPYHDSQGFNYWLAMRGIWGRIQESRVYGIKSALVGDFIWFRFAGLAGVYAPAEMTPDGSGILVETRDPLKEEMVFAELDIKALHKLREKETRDDNQEFWERYFPQIYYYF